MTTTSGRANPVFMNDHRFKFPGSGMLRTGGIFFFTGKLLLLTGNQRIQKIKKMGIARSKTLEGRVCVLLAAGVLAAAWSFLVFSCCSCWCSYRYTLQYLCGWAQVFVNYVLHFVINAFPYVLRIDTHLQEDTLPGRREKSQKIVGG
jgi:hypothetical protein